MGYVGMYSPKGNGFSAFWSQMGHQILAISVGLIMFLRSYNFLIIDKTINESPSQVVFTAISHCSELGHQS